MQIKEFLSREREVCPGWLSNFKSSSGFNPQDFFGSRVVFYPGAGSDGHAVKLFGSSHSAHCFVYADYSTGKASVLAELDSSASGYRGRFAGYHGLARVELTQQQITPMQWIPHVSPANLEYPRITPYAFLEVLERDDDFGDDHGVHRLAILFLGADGFATYDALFCQGNGNRAPYAVMLQDHGFGGNYDSFGAGGLLERLARNTGVFPDWLLVADNTGAWEGFEQVPDIDCDHGGMHAHARCLYKNTRAQSNPINSEHGRPSSGASERDNLNQIFELADKITRLFSELEVRGYRVSSREDGKITIHKQDYGVVIELTPMVSTQSVRLRIRNFDPGYRRGQSMPPLNHEGKYTLNDLLIRLRAWWAKARSQQT